MPPLINTEPDRKSENKFTQVLQIIESIRFTWIENPVEVLQNELHSIGLDGTVLDVEFVLAPQHETSSDSEMTKKEDFDYCRKITEESNLEVYRQIHYKSNEAED